MDTKDQQINELTTDRNEWENKYESEHNQFLDRLQQINKLNSEISNYKHQIELLQSNKDSTINKLFDHNKTIRNVFGDGSDDLLLDSDTNITAQTLQPDKSYGGDTGFYQQSNTDILNGIYGLKSITSIQ